MPGVDSSSCLYNLLLESAVRDDNLQDVMLVIWKDGQEIVDSLPAYSTQGDSLFTVELTDSENGAIYDYYFVAIDSAGNMSYAPENASFGEYFSVEYYSITPGDINFDGDLNIFDLLGMLQYLAASAEPDSQSEKCSLDVNMDGAINIFDLLEILYILQD